jgi:hypothetical protein
MEEHVEPGDGVFRLDMLSFVCAKSHHGTA